MFKKIPAELYERIIENMPVFCVDVVVQKDKKVLLVYRKEEPAKGEWWLPGGRVLKGEKILNAIKRKVNEETGLEVKNIKYLGIQEYFSDKSVFDNIKTGTHCIVGVYLVEVEGDVEIDLTSSDYKWINQIEDGLDDYVKKALKSSGVFES